jgi:hypothetical protein
MRQYAWLDYHGGFWHLTTANINDRDRKWVNRNFALSDLTAEGWVIDATHGTQPKVNHDTNRHLYGYELTRIVH